MPLVLKPPGQQQQQRVPATAAAAGPAASHPPPIRPGRAPAAGSSTGNHGFFLRRHRHHHRRFHVVASANPTPSQQISSAEKLSAELEQLAAAENGSSDPSNDIGVQLAKLREQVKKERGMSDQLV